MSEWAERTELGDLDDVVTTATPLEDVEIALVRDESIPLGQPGAWKPGTVAAGFDQDEPLDYFTMVDSEGGVWLIEMGTDGEFITSSLVTRVTEDDDVRITEDGDTRMLEN